MKSLSKYILLVLLSCWLLMKGIVPAWNTVHSDFANYYVSSSLVVEKASLEKLYDNEWFQNEIKEHGIEGPGKFSPFPPITAWVMVPLTFTDALTAMRIWIVFNGLLLALSIWLIRDLTGWHWSTAALVMMALGNGLVNNFKFGQVYLLITIGLFLVLWLVRQNKMLAAGFILAVLTCLKYLPIALVAGYLTVRNYRIVIATGISMLVLIIFQFLYFGSSVMSEFFYAVFIPHLDGNLSGQGMYSFLFQSWDNLLRHLFIYSSDHNPSPLLDWPQGRTIGKGIIYFCVTFLLVLAIKRILSFKDREKTKSSLLVSLPVLAAFVVLPASATYHFVLLAVPLVLLLSSGIFTEKEKSILAINYALIGFIPYSLFFKIANQGGGLIFAYPRLWLITSLFVVTVVMVVKKFTPRTIEGE